MKLSFYQINKLFIDNSSYLGELEELENKEVNVDVKNIGSFDLLLDDKYQTYNYIKVAKSETDYAYYYLEAQKYYNSTTTRFYYKLDVIRTMKEKDMINHDVNVTRYSNILDMSDEQKAYFWNNQDVKLSSNVIESYKEAYIPYNDDEEVRNKWYNMKWLYVWLQPRDNQSKAAGGTTQLYQYNFKKNITETINVVATEDELPIGATIKHYVLTYKGMDYYELLAFPENSVWYAEDTQRYFRVVKHRRWWLADQDMEYYWTMDGLKDFEYTTTEYFLHTIPEVKISDVPNSLYCMVLPFTEVSVVRNYIDSNGLSKTKKLSWSADNVIPYLFDVEAENNWNEFIVDIKVSMVPPISLNSQKFEFGLDKQASNDIPAVIIPNTIPGNDFTPLETLSSHTVRTEGANTLVSEVFIPFMNTKITELVELDVNFKLPEVTKENVVQKKYYLSTVEQRQELDVPLLNHTKATRLYYYEDLFPGRTNVMMGYGPIEGSKREILYYLLHSPSTLFFDRDTSLPVFTSNYASYIASNKNFIQQAQLQRNSELAQSLISSGSSAIGAGAASAGLATYNPIPAAMNAGAKAINAGITHAVQKKQFNWAVSNMKAAPGNYKAATSTVSLMLSLGLFTLWLEQYKTNEFDVNIYNDLINDIGYEYFQFSYNLKVILDNVFTGTETKKFLQAKITGLTKDVVINLPLIKILQKQLQEGVNIYL